MNSVESFGIIGYGEFGQVAARHLAPHDAHVRIFDTDDRKELPMNAERASLSSVASSDVVVMAVPFEAYDEVIPELLDSSEPDTLVVDVCSVKMRPEQKFADSGLLDRPNVLMTHPLFGPQTTNETIVGKTIVTTDARGPRTQELLNDWNIKGIKQVEMTAQDHDREMAKVHVLPFIIGRSLLEMGVTDSPLTTNYFGKLLALIDVERHHSPELFNTIQQHNPYALNMRAELIATMCVLHAQVIVDGHNPNSDVKEMLNAHRSTIDIIDEYRMVLLGLRFAITDQVGELKAQDELPSIDLEREEAQRLAIDAQAKQANVKVALAQAIQRLVVDEVVTQHNQKKQ